MLKRILPFVALFFCSFSIQATIFTNAASITINDNAAASTYPSTITVSGMSGSITNLQITLNGLSHAYVHDVSLLLQAPTGESILLQSGCAENEAANNLTYTFSDAGLTQLSSTQIWANNGVYKPTNYFQDMFWLPAPAPPPGVGTYLVPGPFTSTGTSTLASAFNSLNPNGTWKLYIGDFASGDAGVLAGGWSLNVTTATVTSTNLVSFDARTNNHHVTLQWNVAQHQALTYFEVQHSSDQSEFTTLATLTSGSNKEFQYAYYEATNGMHYYRLKMKDQNGLISYSPIKALKMDAFTNEAVIYPNPTNDWMTLKLNASQNAVKIIDLYGRTIYEMQVEGHQHEISSKQLGIPGGNYFIQIQNEFGTSVYSLQVR